MEAVARENNHTALWPSAEHLLWMWCCEQPTFQVKNDPNTESVAVGLPAASMSTETTCQFCSANAFPILLLPLNNSRSTGIFCNTRRGLWGDGRAAELKRLLCEAQRETIRN